MKKLSVVFVSVLALMMCVALASCGGSGGGGGGLFGSKTTDVDRLKGEWTFAGKSKDIDFADGIVTFTEDKFTLKAKKGGTDWTYSNGLSYSVISSTKIEVYSADGKSSEQYLFELKEENKKLSLKPQFPIDGKDGVEFWCTKK